MFEWSGVCCPVHAAPSSSHSVASKVGYLQPPVTANCQLHAHGDCIPTVLAASTCCARKVGEGLGRSRSVRLNTCAFKASCRQCECRVGAGYVFSCPAHPSACVLSCRLPCSGLMPPMSVPLLSPKPYTAKPKMPAMCAPAGLLAAAQGLSLAPRLSPSAHKGAEGCKSGGFDPE